MLAVLRFSKIKWLGPWISSEALAEKRASLDWICLIFFFIVNWILIFSKHALRFWPCSSLWDHALHLDARNMKVLSCWAPGKVRLLQRYMMEIKTFSQATPSLLGKQLLFSVWEQSQWAQERKDLLLLWSSLLGGMDVICSDVTCSLQQRAGQWYQRQFRRRDVHVRTANTLWTSISLSSGGLNSSLPPRHTHWNTLVLRCVILNGFTVFST